MTPHRAWETQKSLCFGLDAIDAYFFLCRMPAHENE